MANNTCPPCNHNCNQGRDCPARKKTMTTDLAAALLRDVPRFNVTVGDHTDPSVLLLETEVLAALSAHLDADLAGLAGEVLEGVTPAPDAILAAPVTHLGVNTDGVIDDDVYALMVETEAGGSIIQGLREAMEYTKGMLVEPPAPDAAEAEVSALQAEIVTLKEREEKLRGERDALADELHTMKTGGIIEVADRNNRVTEYMFYWEGRALEAEAKLEESEANLAKAINLLHRHCDPWGMNDFDATTLAELKGADHE